MLKFILAPILGGVIGYITNDLAIKMLFHPRKAVYIGKFKLPFTPGLIPKQKSRIASSIGRVISNQLLNADTLRETLLSPKIIDKMRCSIKQFIDNFAQDNRTVRELMSSYIESEKLEEYEETAKNTAAGFLTEKMLDADLGGIIVDSCLKSFNKSVPFLAGKLDEKTVCSLKSSVSNAVNSLISDNAQTVLKGEIGKLENNLMEMKLSDIYNKNQDKIPYAVNYTVGIYSDVFGSNIDKILASINIEQIVVDKINSFKAEDLEKMIFGIMKHELKAIVYLGAALGFLMGFINLLF